MLVNAMCILIRRTRLNSSRSTACSSISPSTNACRTQPGSPMLFMNRSANSSTRALGMVEIPCVRDGLNALHLVELPRALAIAPIASPDGADQPFPRAGHELQVIAEREALHGRENEEGKR